MERERDQGWLILVALIALSVLVIVAYAMTAPLANWKSPRKPWRSLRNRRRVVRLAKRYRAEQANTGAAAIEAG